MVQNSQVKGCKEGIFMLTSKELTQLENRDIAASIHIKYGFTKCEVVDKALRSFRDSRKGKRAQETGHKYLRHLYFFTILSS